MIEIILWMMNKIKNKLSTTYHPLFPHIQFCHNNSKQKSNFRITMFIKMIFRPQIRTKLCVTPQIAMYKIKFPLFNSFQKQNRINYSRKNFERVIINFYK